MKLSKEIQELLTQKNGLSSEELAKMSEDEVQKYVEEKTGKKIDWPRNIGHIMTMEEVDKQIMSWKKDDDYER